MSPHLRRLSLGLFGVVLPLLSALPLIAAEAEKEKAAPAEKKTAVSDWPSWRGPTHDGIAAAGENPPLEWGEDQNVVWKKEVPGRGHGSPIVCGDAVFLPTAEEEPLSQSVVCYDRRTGDERWKKAVHEGGISFRTLRRSPRLSHASSTPACDGERIFVNFLNDGAVFTTALDLKGEQIWQQKIDDGVTETEFWSSPAIFGPLVIVVADNKAGGVITGMNRIDGTVVWKHDRPQATNYATPVVLKAGGKDQLIITGCDLVASFDPLSGEKNWEVQASTSECVASAISDGELIFSNGGMPKPYVSAVNADGSDKAWQKKFRIYYPGLIVSDKWIYAVSDEGAFECYRTDNGNRGWTVRDGGMFTASPVLVGLNIFATTESGGTVIFKASTRRYQVVGGNHLGSEAYASPAVCGNQVFMRVAEGRGADRQEWLYCIGQTKEEGQPGKQQKRGKRNAKEEE